MIEKEREYAEKIGTFSEKAYGLQVLRHLDVINDKTGALLTHVTIMIAVVGVFLTIFLPTGSNYLFVAFLYIELILYMIIACMLLLCIFVTSPRTFMSVDFEYHVFKIMKKRRVIYNFCLRITIFITIVFTIALMGKFFFMIFPTYDLCFYSGC